MLETSIGLPNTCCKCGKPAGDTWWVNNLDEARAGGGMHAECLPVPMVETKTALPDLPEVVTPTAPMVEIEHKHAAKKAKRK